MITYIKILFILFVILFIIYILVKNFENKNIKYTTTNKPIKFCIDIDSINTDKIENYIKNIDSTKSKLSNSQNNETSTYLNKICPYFKDLKNDANKNELYLTYLSDLLNYKNGLIDKDYMNKWCNICNGLETIKKNPKIKNEFIIKKIILKI